MGILRAQPLYVHIFISDSLLDVEPDVSEEAAAISVSAAVRAVMVRHDITSAGVVYVRSSDHEMWLHDVSVSECGISYDFPVKRSLGA
ncbi:hypothetical protein KDA_25410 [Dictyobacter alpinus]|uniref:Uncharacterized protein n=1 Tax=Dictyobacter alpinus TaxID=2014873 RepID=A0A402B6V2_9CHLR|nr:hypothetical protein [Dictyobacter alpinus]GCE27057.1 hypothetical protein KDA_25410 [Dictyobacter alpinus]